MQGIQEKAIFDFDIIEEWGPRLFRQLVEILPSDLTEIIQSKSPKYIEDARDILISCVNRIDLVEHVIAWINMQAVMGYHGTRVTVEELESIRYEGLRPLIATKREARLRRSLCVHPRWSEVEPLLEKALERFGSNAGCGRREGQVHLTISRTGLVYGFNHYLEEGSEFDGHVAYQLLGQEGPSLLAADGHPYVICVQVSGEIALAACNPWGQIGNELPNLISDILAVWSYWLAYPSYTSASLKLDCGMTFRKPVPAEWIVALVPRFI